MANDVLLLNANASPASWLPISAISWQNAVRLVYIDAATVLHDYDDWVVRSPSTTMKVPSVIMLRQHVRVHNWTLHDGRPPSHLIYLRDLYTCQYCNRRFPRRLLTMDHVTPRHYGGDTTWTNITTACAACNTKRGHDYRIQPATVPFQPTVAQLINNMRQFSLRVPDICWNDYLLWDPERVIVTQEEDEFPEETFDISCQLFIESSP